MKVLDIYGFIFLAIAIVYVLANAPIAAILPVVVGIIYFIKSAYDNKLNK